MDYSKVLTYNPLNSHTLRRLVERHLGVRGSLRTIYLTNDFLLPILRRFLIFEFEICAW